jgi:hypothetical protein
MTETQQRFLRAIAERVPKAQIVEIHLFPPIRQGGVETGVAVVAEDPRVVAPVVVDAVEHGEAVEPIESLESTEPPEPIETAEPLEPVETMEVPEPVETAEPVIAMEDRVADAINGANGGAHRPSSSRLTIYAARYRLTLKGVDRGKWEVDVVAEADAPLDAVDAVVRGVQRRAGEGAEPDRLTSDAFREALEAPLASLER